MIAPLHPVGSEQRSSRNALPRPRNEETIMANANKKHQALQRLKEEVNKKNTELAFVDVMGYGFIGDTLSSGINADDTWTSKLADDQATEVKTEVNHLAGVFRSLITLIDDAIRNTPETDDENDSSGSPAPQ